MNRQQTIERITERLQSVDDATLKVILKQLEPHVDDLEARAWLASDLSRLSEYDPYEWQEGELGNLGEPLSLNNE